MAWRTATLSCDHYPHEGKATKRKLNGGPWAGTAVKFYPCQTELRLERPDGRYVGRYVVRQIQQKTRVITKVEWETREEKLDVVRRTLRRYPVV